MEIYKIYPLHLGDAEIDKSSFTYRRDSGVSLSFPYVSYLIANENIKILVDTGPGSEEWNAKHHYPIRKSKDQEICAALEKAGVLPEEINIVILTHLHWDHCSNNHEFPKARFYLQKAELAFAWKPLPIYMNSYEHLGNGIQPCWYPYINQYETISGDYVLRDGIQILSLPGHSPGSQGVLVNTTGGKYLIAGDCVPLYECWEKGSYGYPLPGGIFTNLFETYESYEKIACTSNYILPGHDYRVFDYKVYPPEV